MIAALIASILVTFPAENQKLPVTDRTYVIGDGSNDGIVGRVGLGRRGK